MQLYSSIASEKAVKRLWTFVKDPQNLAALAALATLLGFLWNELRPMNRPAAPLATLPAPIPTPIPTPATQRATAIGGGMAINAANQSQVTLGNEPTTSATGASAASTPKPPASQEALADSGGTAINASDAARVKIKQAAEK